LLRRFEGHEIRVVALSIANSVDCAFVRLLVNDSDRGRELLQLSKFAFSEIDFSRLSRTEQWPENVIASPTDDDSRE
jgi:hypothetical protein